MRHLFLSYPLTSEIPIYGKTAARIEFKVLSSKKKSGFNRTGWMGLGNHWGTHVDAPAHFFERGPSVSALPARTWRFETPQVLSIRLEPGALVSKKDIEGRVDHRTDLLLLRSGWWKKRGGHDYSLRNPGVLAEVGLWLRRACPKLRAVGFDWISLSSFLNRGLGREAHRAFLDPNAKGSPILIFEDMDLSANLQGLLQVWAMPLRVAAADSAPCTVIGVCR